VIKPEKVIKPIRCISCGKIIAEGFMKEGVIEIDCRCGTINKIQAQYKKPEGRSYQDRIGITAK
jgi:phage FluMu protein Com